jgi:DNA-dependent protein kinase catalytic subunit
MFRKYRMGELPDVQIKHRELLLPLQALAQRDDAFAAALFTNLVAAVNTELDTRVGAREANHLRGQVCRGLDALLTDGAARSAPFVACIEQLCVALGHVTISPAAISRASCRSHSLHAGALLLEQRLLKEAPGEAAAAAAAASGPPSAKRARQGGRVATNTALFGVWVEMAKIYRALGEFDVLKGIFVAQPKTKPITRMAVDCEAAGRIREVWRDRYFIYFSLVCKQLVVKPLGVHRRMRRFQKRSLRT